MKKVFLEANENVLMPKGEISEQRQTGFHEVCCGRSVTRSGKCLTEWREQG